MVFLCFQAVIRPQVKYLSMLEHLREMRSSGIDSGGRKILKKKKKRNQEVFFNQKKKRLEEDVETVFQYRRSCCTEDRNGLFSTLIVDTVY